MPRGTGSGSALPPSGLHHLLGLRLIWEQRQLHPNQLFQSITAANSQLSAQTCHYPVMVIVNQTYQLCCHGDTRGSVVLLQLQIKLGHLSQQAFGTLRDFLEKVRCYFRSNEAFHVNESQLLLADMTSHHPSHLNLISPTREANQQ